MVHCFKQRADSHPWIVDGTWISILIRLSGSEPNNFSFSSILQKIALLKKPEITTQKSKLNVNSNVNAAHDSAE